MESPGEKGWWVSLRNERLGLYIDTGSSMELSAACLSIRHSNGYHTIFRSTFLVNLSSR